MTGLKVEPTGTADVEQAPAGWSSIRTDKTRVNPGGQVLFGLLV
jgi:hypothetical protein